MLMKYADLMPPHETKFVPVWSSGTVGAYVTFPVEPGTIQEMVMQAFQAFVNEVSDIPSVEQVRAQVAGAYIHIVTYMSQSTLDQRFAVFDVQQQLYERFPDLRLEFDLIDRQGYPVEENELTGKYIEVIRDLPDRTDLDALHEGN